MRPDHVWRKRGLKRGVSHVSGLSHRNLIASTAPTPEGSFSQVEGARSASAKALKRDPLLVAVAAWVAAHEEIAGLEREWADLEQQLSLKMDLDGEARSGLPEASKLRRLTRKIRAADRRLEQDAGRIATIRATTLAGVLAKIELGLRIQGPYNWQDNALALVQGGIEQLRELC